MIALGGNAIKKSYEKGTTEEQFKNCQATAKSLAKIILNMKREDRLVVTHGNGPQAGNLLVQQEIAKAVVPPHPMDVVGAMTQGQIGYMLQQSLMNALKDLGIETPVCAIVNQVLANKEDPEFVGDMASEPVGEFLTEEEAEALRTKYPDYIFKKVRPNGERPWRRTVPSPDPKRNLGSEAIKRMVDSGIIVIASGGGGIPVIEDGEGHYEGVEAVIDKDLAGEVLAEVIKADIFLILTDVEKVKLNFGKPDEKNIEKMTVEEAELFLKEGHFLPGSMGPKVKACIRFLKLGGKMAIITSLEKALEALRGESGTKMIMSHEDV
jgi:carbamate kinase